MRSVPEIPVTNRADRNTALGVSLLETVPVPDHDPYDVVALFGPLVLMTVAVNGAAPCVAPLLVFGRISFWFIAIIVSLSSHRQGKHHHGEDKQ
jgi:hypothetical protein